jgi:CHAT domain-containing protein/cytochrome c-type biogenesis protein CcmH/NrfG
MKEYVKVIRGDQHLSPEMIVTLIDDKPVVFEEQLRKDIADALEHLGMCISCQQRTRAYQDAEQQLQILKVDKISPHTQECPEDSVLRELSQGLTTAESADALLKHVITCDHCGPLFQQSTTDLSRELSDQELRAIDNLTISETKAQAKLARRLTTLAHITSRPQPLRPRRPMRTTILLATAAAALILCVVVPWIYRVRKDNQPEALLAQAYADQRTFDLRIDGAPHVPLRQERGAARSALSKPLSLLRAEYEIREGLIRRPDDVTLLLAKGRAELLEWQYDEAIKTLSHTHDLNPQSSSVLTDLATAYSQRGDEEERSRDYGQAIEYLGEAIQKDPKNLVALFNLAVVEERLYLFENAARDWESYLRLDPHGDWTNEAREHLEAIRRKQKRSSNHKNAAKDPTVASLALSERAMRKSNDVAWSDSLDEEYLDIAIEEWLPFVSAAPHSRILRFRRQLAWRSLILLSNALIAEHHDKWLADVVSTPESQSMGEGWNALARSARDNEEGNFDQAARFAAKAQTIFKRTSRAAYLRASWEHAYALQRSQQGSSCLQVLDTAGRTIDLREYPWLAVQILLERSICSSMVGQMGSVKSQVKSALSIADSARYGTLVLRTYHILGIQASSQDPDDAWKWFSLGLARHWEGSYRPFRVYQFCAEMSLTAENQGRWHLARALMQEGVIHIERTPNRLMEAVARHSLAVDSEMAGLTDLALSNFRRAAELFTSMVPTPAVKALHFSTLVYQASLLSQEGHDESALHLLQVARGDFVPQSQYWTWLLYYQALGEVLLHQGNLCDAEHALHAAISISESALATINNENERSHWERLTMRAYRSLVQLEIKKGQDAQRPLEIWEWYISAPIRIPRGKTLKPKINFNKLSNITPPELSQHRINLSELRGVTVVSFAELGDGPVAWAYDDRGIETIHLHVSNEELNLAAVRFARLCSDRSSPLSDIRQSGRQLYNWLLAPFETRLDPTRVLVIETDGPLRFVPFSALITGRGQYLNQVFALVSSPGLEYWSSLRRDPDFSRLDTVLAVGVTSGVMDRNSHLPFLPDSQIEAEDVSKSFVRSHLLLGSQATIEAVQRELPSSRVFHYAGHALTGSTMSGLFLAVSSDSRREDKRGFLDAESVGHLPLHNVDLVVLSACSTGGRDTGLNSSYGLAHVFLSAGIPHVIASNWEIDSVAAREFMRDFYRYLLAGNRPARALALSSRSVQQRPDTAHPYYWAAFSAFGRN